MGDLRQMIGLNVIIFLLIKEGKSEVVYNGRKYESILGRMDNRFYRITILSILEIYIIIMEEDEVMNIVFKALHSNNVQTVSAKHDNNQIMFTPDMKEKWMITVTKVEQIPA